MLNLSKYELITIKIDLRLVGVDNVSRRQMQNTAVQCARQPLVVLFLETKADVVGPFFPAIFSTIGNNYVRYNHKTARSGSESLTVLLQE